MWSPNSWKILRTCWRGWPNTAPTSMAWRAATRCADRSRTSARRARGGRQSRLVKLMQEMPELAADLDVSARGSAHAPTRRARLLRHHFAAPNIDAVGFQRTVGLLERAHDSDTRTGLELALIAHHISTGSTASGGTTIFFSPSLYLTITTLPIDAGDRLVDRAIGHRAVRPRVPRPMALAQPALRFGQNRHLDRALASIRLRHRADADIRRRA